MRKMYLSAPLPFVGQKRMLAKEFMKVLEQYPDGTLFVGKHSASCVFFSPLFLPTFVASL